MRVPCPKCRADVVLAGVTDADVDTLSMLDTRAGVVEGAPVIPDRIVGLVRALANAVRALRQP